MVCRVCLEEALDICSIFDEKTDKDDFTKVEILQQHFWFKLTPNDAISTSICHSCWSKVDDFHQFYMSVKAAHLLLCAKINFDDGSCSESSEEVLRSVQAPQLEVIIKEEFPKDKGNSQRDANALEESDSDHYMEPEFTDFLAEPEARLEVPEFKAVSDDFRNDPVKQGKRLRTKLKQKLGTRSNKQKSKDSTVPKEDSAEPSSPVKMRRGKRKTYSENDDEIIKKHIAMGCDLCTFVGKDFTEMIEHFRERHVDQKPYIKCCGRKIRKRFLLLQHAYRHEDPEFFKCRVCLKVFADDYILRAHMLANHAPAEQLKFGCSQCEKRFPRQYLLDLHTPSHIPHNERKFFCDKCPEPRAFASDHLLKIHKSMRHKRAINVCHVCAKEIRDNQAFEKHVRLHFEDSGPRVKCPKPGCDRWLKDEDNLRQHMRRHNDEGKTFTCEECGKNCKNRRSLASHFNYAHTKDVFTCDECGKNFKRAINLKEHMAQHTGVSLYKCPFCERTFNSNANMHSHKKKMHPVEWDVWRKTKRGSSQQEIGSTMLTKATTNSTGGSGSFFNSFHIDSGLFTDATLLASNLI